MDDKPAADYALYLRKSKGRAGIARQRTITTAHIKHLGGHVAAEFPDTDRTAYRKIGAERPERENFDRMLLWLGVHPGARIAAWHADRLSRDVEVTEDLIRACVTGSHLVDTPSGGTYDLATATGRKRLRQDALDATYEVDHMTERITAQKTEAAVNGDWRGGRRPFGYEKDGVTVRQDEADALAAAIRAVIGGQSLGGITRRWNASGIRTSTGGPWRASQLGATLARARNAGLIEHDGEIIGPAIWHPVVTEREWRAVRVILADPARRTSPGNARRWLLSGLALCGICGGPLIGTTTGGKNGRSRPVYRCRAAGLHVGRDSHALDAYISGLVVGFLERPDSIAELAAAMPAPDTATLHAEIAAVRAELDGLADAAGQRQITTRMLVRSTEPLMADLEELETRLAAAERPAILSPFAGHEPAEVWEAMPLESKRAVVAELFTVTVHPAPKGRPAGWRAGMSYFDAESVQIERNLGEG
jgi:DNA invertase Pin-like site-specific DNA recombinase